MKILLTIAFILSGVVYSYAQTDSVSAAPVEWPNKEYMQDIYDPNTKTINPSYNYSNKWDLDGDHKKDSLFFIGDGAAHTYFYLRILLSSDHLMRNFPFIQLDMPYFENKELLEKYGKHPGVQFVVDDFDKDGILDIYLNFNSHFATIPKAWRQKGMTSKYIMMSFAGGKLKIKNY